MLAHPAVTTTPHRFFKKNSKVSQKPYFSSRFFFFFRFLAFSLEYPSPLTEKINVVALNIAVFVDLDGLHVSDEIGFSVPHGLKPLVFGDKCLLCGNTV